MRHALLLLFYWYSSAPAPKPADAPDDFLPHELGETFTPH